MASNWEGPGVYTSKCVDHFANINCRIQWTGALSSTSCEHGISMAPQGSQGNELHLITSVETCLGLQHQGRQSAMIASCHGDRLGSVECFKKWYNIYNLPWIIHENTIKLLVMTHHDSLVWLLQGGINKTYKKCASLQVKPRSDARMAPCNRSCFWRLWHNMLVLFIIFLLSS